MTANHLLILVCLYMNTIVTSYYCTQEAQPQRVFFDVLRVAFKRVGWLQVQDAGVIDGCLIHTFLHQSPTAVVH